MPTFEEIQDAVWDTVINGAQAREILRAFLEYSRLGGGSSWNRPFRGVQYRRWFYSNWLPQPAADLPQSPIRVVRGRIAPGNGHPGALRPPTPRRRTPRGEPTLDHVGARSDHPIARTPWSETTGRGPEHTSVDEDIEAILVAMLLLDED